MDGPLCQCSAGTALRAELSEEGDGGLSARWRLYQARLLNGRGGNAFVQSADLLLSAGRREGIAAIAAVLFAIERLTVVILDPDRLRAAAGRPLRETHCFASGCPIGLAHGVIGCTCCWGHRL
jgi:hypothetical protein